MKICITAMGDNLDSEIDARFGRCNFFIVIDTDTMEYEAVKNINANSGGGAGIQSGQLVNEKGINAANGKTVVFVDPSYFRPTEVDTLLGDSSKAKEKLGWEPKVGFEDLVKEMVRADLEDAKKDELCQKAGFQVCNHNE